MNCWRLIDSGPCGAHYNMALDEAIAECVRAGGSPPALRLYGWDTPSVSIGFSQRAGEVDAEYCRAHGVPLVRRPTGGRGILHGDELTYSFSSATGGGGAFTGRLFEDYGLLGRAFFVAFQRLGLRPEVAMSRRNAGPRSPLCFQSASYGEIKIGGKKVIGSAQRRWPGGLLQQGSLPYSMDYVGIGGAFGKASPEAEMAGLRDFLPGIGPEELKAAVRAGFEEALGVRLAGAAPTRREEALAERLLQEKYLRPGWNLRR